MSAKARDAPPSSASTRQLSSSELQQPVLQVGAVDEVHGAALAGGDAVARLVDRRVVAVDERHRGDARRGGGEVGEPLRALGVDGERLLADTCLPAAQRPPRQVLVEVVRRADVDDVDVRVRDERLGAVVGPLGAEPRRGGPRPLGASRRRRRRPCRRRRGPRGRGRRR